MVFWRKKKRFNMCFNDAPHFPISWICAPKQASENPPARHQDSLSSEKRFNMSVCQRFTAFFNLCPQAGPRESTCSISEENISAGQPQAVPNSVHRRQGSRVVCLVWGEYREYWCTWTPPLPRKRSRPHFDRLFFSPPGLLMGEKVQQGYIWW